MIAIGAICGALAAALVIADDPTPPPILAVDVRPGLPFRDFDAGLLAHLRAELAASQVTVVRDEGTGVAASARLTVASVAGDGRVVTLAVHYLRSGTVVQRQLDLSALPDDGAALAVAVAVDELIRATGALGDMAAPAAPPPTPVVVAPVETARPRPPRAELRVLIAGERQRDGALAVGPDAVLSYLFGARLSVDAHVGWRNNETRSAPDGSIDSHAVTAGVGLAFAMPARSEGRRLGADLHLRIDAAWVNLHGTAGASATGFATSALGLSTVAGIGGWGTIVPPFSLVAFAGWQLPLRTVTATDGDRAAAVVYAPGLTAAAGIGARF